MGRCNQRSLESSCVQSRICCWDSVSDHDRNHHPASVSFHCEFASRWSHPRRWQQHPPILYFYATVSHRTQNRSLFSAFLTQGAAQPAIVSAPAAIGYGKSFAVTVSFSAVPSGVIELNLLSAPFVTHSYSQVRKEFFSGSRSRSSTSTRTCTHFSICS